jgi:hypothetical protein
MLDMYIAKRLLAGIILLMLALNTVEAREGSTYSIQDMEKFKPMGDPALVQFNLTGTWMVQIPHYDELKIIQLGNEIKGTMRDENVTMDDPEPDDPIAGTIYGAKVEFTRTNLNEWTRQYSGIVSGTPDHLSIEGTYTDTKYPGQHAWSAIMTSRDMSIAMAKSLVNPVVVVKRMEVGKIKR